MIRLIKRDLILLSNNKTAIIVYILAFPILMLIPFLKDSLLLATFVMMMCIIPVVSSTYGTEILFHSLPVKGIEVIFSRFLELFAVYVVIGLYIFLWNTIFRQFPFYRGRNIDISFFMWSLIFLVASGSLHILFGLLAPEINRYGHALWIAIINQTVGKDYSWGGTYSYSYETTLNMWIFIAVTAFIISLVASFRIYRDWEGRRYL